MRLYRWIPDHGENLGDWLSVPILRALGHELEPPTQGERCLVAIGSILHHPHYVMSRASGWTVWGAGIGDCEPPPEGFNLDFRAVRGPLTQEAWKLPASMPLGDPALLLPRLVKLPKSPHGGEVLYVRHIGDDEGHNLPGAVGISARTTAADGLGLVARIAAAGFVASESLHGCIVAAAYGVPWSPCSVRWKDRIGAKSKWNDWMAYLKIESLSQFPATLAEARLWWERIGRHARIGELSPLLGALPS